MIHFNFTSDCYSCSACASVCSAGAIRFDDRLLPVVDPDKCVDCGRCEQVCVKLKEPAYRPALREDALGFVCRNTDEEERVSSSSGGVFILLAKEVLAQGGSVCGCIYDDAFLPSHILTSDPAMVRKMMGSKYVKSDMGDCIREMETVLKSGRPVLFSGVPCQSAAVKSCLGHYPGLSIVNIVCHGSIEREFWQSFLAQARTQGEIADITMRDKSRGWDNYGLRIRYKDGKEHVTFRNQDGFFLRCFTSGLFQRERCLKCGYKGSAIAGDLLLGDGWGMEQVCPEFCDAYGVSSVIALTQKGRSLLEAIEPRLLSRPIDVPQIVSRNGRIVSPAPDMAFRRRFQSKCRKDPVKIEQLCEEYARPSFPKRVINKLYAFFS